MEPEADFAEFLARKRRGGQALSAFVSRGVYLGGLLGERAHEPFVALGPADWEGEEELCFFADRAALERFIAELRATADDAWGATPAPPS